MFTFYSCLDGSTIYGSSKDEAEELRTFVRGKLRVQTDGKHEELLPADTNDLDCRMSNGFSCFKSGDVRVNEHPSLVGKCGCCAFCVNFDGLPYFAILTTFNYGLPQSTAVNRQTMRLTKINTQL